MEQGNRSCEISCVTVASVAVEDQETHLDHRKCDRRGCRRRASDESDYCAKHDADIRRYKRDYDKRTRARWEAEGRCTRCGASRRAQGSKWCAACPIKLDRLELPDQDSQLDHAVRVSRDEADGFLRRRYHGKMKRGAPGIDEQDVFERKIVESCVARYKKAAEKLASAEGKAMTKEDREGERLEGLTQLAMAVRAAEEILDRNRFDARLAKHLERERVSRQRSLSATAAKIAKSGR